MIERFKNEKPEYKLLTLAVLAAALFFVFRIIYAGIIALPYPKELLEPANIALTNSFIEGISPYTTASLEREVPGVNYDYPPLNSLVGAAIAVIAGCNAVYAHFAISLFCILASGLIGYLIVARYTRITVAPVLAALLFMFCHWRFGYISAAPDDLGLLVYLLTLYAASSEKVKSKSVWCAIGITLCFYTKQYFIFVAIPVFVYLFLCSRKEALRLFVITLGVNLAVAWIISVEWPLYWMKTIVFTYLGAGIGGGFKISTFFEQLDYLVFSFAALFAVVVVAAFMGIRNLRKSGIQFKGFKVNKNDAFVLSAVTAVIMLIPLFVIGRNDGALISYFLQLWMPSVSVVALVCMERILPTGDYLTGRLVSIVSYVIIVVFTLYFGFGRMPLHILSDEEVAEWQKAYGYTAKYSSSGDVFYSRSLAYDGFARENGEWQCGHEGEVSSGTIGVISDIGIPQEYLPYLPAVVNQNLEYREGIIDKVRNHQYSLITFDIGANGNLFDEEFCEQNGYKCIDRLELQLGNMPYETVFYAYFD